MAAFPAVDELDSQPALSTRHQSVPGSVYSNEQMAVMDENLRRASAMDFSANQPLASVNPFGFDASMAALDPAYSANMQMQMQMTGASQGIVPDMSMDAQYQAAMGYAQLSAPSAAFQSTMGMSQMNPFLSNSPSMPLSLDTDLGGGMGDVFATNQFGTPILTSPMVANFGRSNVRIVQPANGRWPSFSTPDREFTVRSQWRSGLQGNSNTPNAKVKSLPSPRKSRKSDTQLSDASWLVVRPVERNANKSGGWPSSMPGSKPHTDQDDYKDAYAKSGFDLLDTLVSIPACAFRS